MSDKLRRAAGILLTAACIVLCFIPMITAAGKQEKICRSGDRLQWSLDAIPTETHKDGIRINEADEEELCRLPRVGEHIAAMIIEEREINGPFYYAEDLESVKGIGPKTLGEFRDQLDLMKDESGE